MFISFNSFFVGIESTAEKIISPNAKAFESGGGATSGEVYLHLLKSMPPTMRKMDAKMVVN